MRPSAIFVAMLSAGALAAPLATRETVVGSDAVNLAVREVPVMPTSVETPANTGHLFAKRRECKIDGVTKPCSDARWIWWFLTGGN